MQNSPQNKLDAVVSNAKVLVIDDAGSIRQIEVELLRDLGFNQVYEATDGAKAWKILCSDSIDLVICDWDMPNLSGIELLHKVRKEPNLKDIPFMMITASSEERRVKLAISEGVNDYIVKPFQPKDFAYRIVKLIRKIQK